MSKRYYDENCNWYYEYGHCMNQRVEESEPNGLPFFDYLIRYDGKKCAISKELYVLTEDNGDTSYKKDDVVVLIGGVDGRYNTPGHHFNRGWVTVSRPFAIPANFIGVERSKLKLFKSE